MSLETFRKEDRARGQVDDFHVEVGAHGGHPRSVGGEQNSVHLPEVSKMKITTENIIGRQLLHILSTSCELEALGLSHGQIDTKERRCHHEYLCTRAKSVMVWLAFLFTT